MGIPSEIYEAAVRSNTDSHNFLLLDSEEPVGPECLRRITGSISGSGTSGKGSFGLRLNPQIEKIPEQDVLNALKNAAGRPKRRAAASLATHPSFSRDFRLTGCAIGVKGVRSDVL
jgi:hypothetical protein